MSETTWRDIPCCDVDWIGCNETSRRAAHAVWRQCQTRDDGRWSALTLGDLANMGERKWRRVPDIGDVAVSVIKATIDMAAEGKRVTKVIAADAYIPTCERNKEHDL